MKKLLFIILLMLTTELSGQTLQKSKKGQYAEVNIEGSQNTVKVIQGEKVIVYDLADKKQYDAFVAYLKKIPTLVRDLHHIETLTKENNQLLKQMLYKSQGSGVFDPSTFLQEYGKLAVENQKLKDEVEAYRKQTQDTELIQLLAEANKKLNVFDSDGYQSLLENFKQKRKIKIAQQQHEIAQISYLQARNNHSNYQLDRALEQIDEALFYESDNSEYLFEKGHILDEKGEYVYSIIYYQKALLIEEKVLGKENPETAITYNNLGLVHNHKGDYAIALNYHKKALEIQEKLLDKEHPIIAITYNNLGLVYDNQGNYVNAINYFQKALVIYEKVLGKEDPKTATSYINLGAVYDKQRDYVKAIMYYKKALLVFEKGVSKKHPSIAATYNNLGLVYKNQGDYTTAISYYEKSMDILEKVLGKEHPSTATSYNNLGLIYDKQGNYSTAIKFYEKALSIREKIFGNEHPFTVDLCYNLGVNYDNIGDYTNAILYFEKALRINEKKLGKEHPSTSDLYILLGLVYLAKGEKENGIAYLQKTWLDKQILSKQAQIIIQVGVQVFHKNQYLEAINYFAYALELMENGKVAKEEDLWAIVYQNLAKVHCYNGNQKQALLLFEKALELAKFSKMDTTKIVSNYEECKNK
ncbi:tetratricopeptide repeat protein [Arcicella lustrica]|uniref:Tetratricopeptide repeat protein n=1 Tax=Arcicella lustrica TaxID=2984196 RepID=A0ABU5SDJ1_9BACT|nr:tetratricopeptide repeat protein [Arcicella sp. DC25W]MEA5425359.1 tetratricopeptide repeat protein [Arcicella sp. DC25W]